MKGRIIAEYEDYSVFETPMSEPATFITDTPWGMVRYRVAQSMRTRVATYEQALLEPEDEVFV